ncbi:MAG: hypothetical protein E7Z68_06785 [Thermoplasmata archaeon]|nr:hypothetical protein [Thermoplasmata archaeon]
MFRIAVYGKGGIGKSTISSNISFILSSRGYSVLHVGCDPKHDSTRLLTKGETIETLATGIRSDPLVIGSNGVMCAECDGPEPGRGCAGKRLEILLDRLSSVDSDYRLYDVLGDVVCGGFSIPARRANVDAILIVTSGEFMSLYAANNILRALERINPTKCVMGLILNSRGDDSSAETYSKAVGIPIVCRIERSNLFCRSESEGRCLSDMFPDSNPAASMRRLCDTIEANGPLFAPSHLSEEGMTAIARGTPADGAHHDEAPRPGCRFVMDDPIRGRPRGENNVVHSCASHGAADGVMKIRDAALILDGPRTCSYLMEMAFMRRMANGLAERRGSSFSPGIYSTSLDGRILATDPESAVDLAVAKARADGFRFMFLVPTCASAMVGSDIRRIGDATGRRHGAEVIPVDADSPLLHGRFGGSTGLVEALVSRMRPMETESGTANLIARWFYGYGRDWARDVFDDILSRMGIRVRFRFLDYCEMKDIDGFCKAEYDIQLGSTPFNNWMCERISKSTGRRPALKLDIPMGLEKSLEWTRKIAEYAPELGWRQKDAEKGLSEEYERGMSAYIDRLEGKRVALHCSTGNDMAWQTEALRFLRADLAVIAYSKSAGPRIQEHDSDLGRARMLTGIGPCAMKRIAEDDSIDIVITDDLYGDARQGFKWAPLGSKYYGIKGSVHWARIVSDSLRTCNPTWETGL